MEKPLVNLLQSEEVKVKRQIWAVFYFVYRMCRNRFWATYNKLAK